MKNDQITILTTSCKAYEDVLHIHEFLYQRHWPDCPFKRVLVMDEITEGADYLNGYDEVIVAGKETGRKNHLRVTMALEKIDTPYVIFVQEDMLLNEAVQTDKILKLLDVLKKYDAGTIRLLPFYGNANNTCVQALEDNIVEYLEDTPYRISYAPSIWDREFLLQISRQYEYGADFERKGTEFAKTLGKRVLGYRFVAYPFFNSILRGKWQLPAVNYLGYYGIEPDFSKHALPNPKESLKQEIRNYIYNTHPYLTTFVLRVFQIGKRN